MCFDKVFESHYQGKEQEQFSQLVKNFAGKSKDARGLRKQVYMIYDFLQSTSNPQAWLEDSFLNGFRRRLILQSPKKNSQILLKEKLWDLESFFRHHLENDAKEIW